MAGLTWRPRARAGPGARGSDLWWVVGVGGAAALILGWALTISPQAACAFAVVLVVVALYQHDRRWGITAMFALWLVAPALRRLFGLMTGYVDNDPLSLAPFLATGALAVLELSRLHVPSRIRRILLLAAAGLALGLPVGLVTGPRPAVYAFVAYLAALSGAVLGLGEGPSVRDSVLRRVLLFGLPPIAAYAILQRVVGLPSWDEAWVEATNLDLSSIGTLDELRVFASLNHPGALAPLLALSLLCYLTIGRARTVAVAGAALLAVALALTFVRSAWVALVVAAVAHVIASDGRSARLVFGSGAVIVAATLALSPVSTTAQDVVNRFKTITNREDASSAERSATFSATFPTAAAAPLGHGVGSAGEPSKLKDDPNLRAPDNGYLGLMYQVGPIGFLLVMGAVGYITVAAWNGARARAPGQEMRLLLFAMIVFVLVQLYAGDAFYGALGVVFWFVGGQVLAYDYRRRMAESRAEPALM